MFNCQLNIVNTSFRTFSRRDSPKELLKTDKKQTREEKKQIKRHWRSLLDFRVKKSWICDKTFLNLALFSVALLWIFEFGKQTNEKVRKIKAKFFSNLFYFQDNFYMKSIKFEMNFTLKFNLSMIIFEYLLFSF